MALQSQRFRGDPKLEAAAVSDSAHIFLGARGPHVGKIQGALIGLDGAKIAQDEVFGPATAAAVDAFKRKRNILNFQGKIDNIVGKKTIAALDGELQLLEQRSGNVQLNFKIGEDLLAVQHTLLYFSGVADDFGNGGKLLKKPHGQEVLTDMENMSPVSPQTKTVAGFGGTLSQKPAVLTAAAGFLAENHDARGKLIIYGYSAGGINSLDLCRFLNLVGQKVDLLVTVDVSGRGERVDRTVPRNVVRNRNYFQTEDIPFITKAVGGPARGQGVVNINCDDRPFDNIVIARKSRHGQMQDITRRDARVDMVIELNKT